MEHKAKNSIVSLYNKLEFKPNDGENNKFISEHVERARSNAQEELRTIIGMKCNDLLYYMMRHFSVDFNLDEQEIPRQWPNYKPEEISKLYVSLRITQETLKEKYLDMIPNFLEFELDNKAPGGKKEAAFRATMMESKSANSNQLLNSVEMANLKKKMLEQMNNEYQEALKKNVSILLCRKKYIWGRSLSGAGSSSCWWPSMTSSCGSSLPTWRSL